MVPSKPFVSSEAVISRLSKNACLYDNSNSFQSKMLYIVLIFKWSHLDTHLWICNLCICHKHSNRTPTFGKGSSIQKIPQMGVQVCPPDKPSKWYLRYRISLTTLKRVVKWGKDSCTVIEKSASSLHLFWNGKRKQVYQFIYKKKQKKRNEMRWKWSLVLNNKMRMNDMKMKPCI